MSALLYSLAVCAVSVAFESAFAGRGIKQRLVELRIPRFAPSFRGWIIIGAIYYIICFVILYRLFSTAEPGSVRTWALGLLLAMMLINALWNYFFFRTRNLFHAYLIGLPYSFIAVALFFLLWQFERPAALCLSLYLVYLFYASWFGYRIWKLNSPPLAGRRFPG